jgi:hypothetical protein
LKMPQENISAAPEEIRQLLKYITPQLQLWWQWQPTPYQGPFYIPPNPLQIFAAQLISNLMGTTYPWIGVGYQQYWGGGGGSGSYGYGGGGYGGSGYGGGGGGGGGEAPWMPRIINDTGIAPSLPITGGGWPASSYWGVYEIPGTSPRKGGGRAR